MAEAGPERRREVGPEASEFRFGAGGQSRAEFSGLVVVVENLVVDDVDGIETGVVGPGELYGALERPF